MKAALKRDRARTNVLTISDLGLLEMTRQRVEESHLSSMYVDCPYCRGRGNVKSPLGVSVDIQRQVAAMIRRRRSTDKSASLQIVLHPSVLDRIRAEDEEFLLEMEQTFKASLSFRSDPTKHVEFFAIRDAEDGEVLYSTMDK
jgi:ribonuclease G